jgi:hypothetical protein
LSSLPAIKVVGEKESKLSTLPTTKIECPKCGHDGRTGGSCRRAAGTSPRRNSTGA